MAESKAEWYIVHTYSGYENAVASTVLKAAENRGMMKTEESPNPSNEVIFDVTIPVETVTEYVEGKEKISERKVFPGYVLIRMAMTDESWHLVRNVRGVTGFVGSGNKAVPLTEEEVRSIGLEKRVAVAVGYDVGSAVKIVDGPFDGFIGKVESVDKANARAQVIVSMFGRETPVDLEFRQIQAV
ncbi:MAG: transcription termination/antitermination protein NusG [Oscillospiraceae bacterium]|jgi:transcriptional antiterminator NusG|nr:transcription termination/antitermination protein NusG [Oscillospiraceae bacterium]